MRLAPHGVGMVALFLVVFLASGAASVSVLDAIPQCYQDCIKNTGDFTCNGIDIQCLCRLSKGNFLTNLISCMRSNCDNNLNITALISPVASICAENGVPVASAAIASAQSIASSLAVTKSTSFTGATTVTTTFASAGTMYVVAVPLSITSGSSGLRTVTATPSTIIVASINGGTARASSTPTSTSSNSSSIVTPATTPPTRIGSTMAAVATTTGSQGSSTARPQNGGNGSPFSSDANLLAHLRYTWLASSIILVVCGMIWLI